MRDRYLIAAGSLVVVGVTMWLAGAVVAGQAPSATDHVHSTRIHLHASQNAVG